MKPTHKLMVANGKYEKDGQEKTRWLQIGTLFEKDGKQSIKLDCVPVGNEFEGWVQVFKIEPRQENEQANPIKTIEAKDKYDDDPININNIPF